MGTILTSFVYKVFLRGFLIRYRVRGEIRVRDGLGDGFRVRDRTNVRGGLGFIYYCWNIIEIMLCPSGIFENNMWSAMPVACFAWL